MASSSSSRRISISVFALVILSFAVSVSEAKEILVGGKDASWTVGSSKNLTQWAQKKRFKIGDQLKWKLEDKVGSVVEVTQEGYESCDTTKAVKGNVSEITLDRSGPFFFVSGDKNQCQQGLKLTVVVLHKTGNAADSPAPAPAPAHPPSSDGFSLSAGFMGFAGLVALALI